MQTNRQYTRRKIYLKSHTKHVMKVQFDEEKDNENRLYLTIELDHYFK